MNFKKILALVLVVIMTAAVTFGATLAFLTDETETKHNVFTAGNVDVSLTEKTEINGEPVGREDGTGADYHLVAPGDKLTKRVTVTNNGPLDAYVAVTVKLNNAGKINAAIDDVYEKAPYNYAPSKIQAIYDEVFEGWGINYNPRPGAADVDDARGVIDDAGSVWKLPEEILQVDFSKTTDFDSDTTMFGINNWFKSETEEKADAYSAWLPGGGFYTSELKDDETTADVDERDYVIVYTYYIYLEDGESVTLFEGLNVPEYFTNEQMVMFDGLEIDISGAAIQADNFGEAGSEEAAKAAFEALHALPTPVEPDVPDVYDAIVSNNDELATAVAEGKTNIYMNAGTYTAPAAAKGKTLTLTGAGAEETVIEVVPAGQGEAGGQLDYNFDGSNVTFNDLTIKTNSQLYAGYARLSGTYNNCVIQNTYNLGTGNSAFYNCEINITNEYLRVGGASTAVFDGCTFNTDGRAILVFQDGTSVAQTVTVKDCTFNATAAANTWNGIHIAAVSIDGTNGSCVVNLEGTNTVDSDFNGLWQIKTGEASVTVNQ